MTRTGKHATKEQRAASEYLGSLGDSLAPWVQSTGPVDAYETHLPVEVRDPLEWLSFAIVSQQLSRAAAVAIYNRLVGHLGGSITAERIIATDEEALHGVGLSLSKAGAIRRLAQQVDDGSLELHKFATMSDADVEAQLVAIPRIGPWSAQTFLMWYLHRPDVFPAGDVGVRAAITALDGRDERITPKFAEHRSQLWRPYRSYATSYLWGYLREFRPAATGLKRARRRG